ncbi:unnamed protein product, partial [Ceratitis capitata]
DCCQLFKCIQAPPRLSIGKCGFVIKLNENKSLPKEFAPAHTAVINYGMLDVGNSFKIV